MSTLGEGLYHIPVMLDECMRALNIKPGGIYFDGTLGGGGHTEAILSSGGHVIAVDRDNDALEFASKRLEKNPAFAGKYTLIKDNFKNAREVLNAQNINLLDGALLDLGISSHQIDEAQRGFSYMRDARLDMRMDTSQKLSAYDIVNFYREEEIADIIFTYGEDRFSRRIAKKITETRKTKPIETTLELADLITSCVPYIKGAGHAAKKTFQALRISINGELDGLKDAVCALAGSLKKGAVLAVITFHSLEDRIVKQTFKALSTECICPKTFPVCVCGHKAEVKLVTHGGVKPSETEQNQNSRAKSAILRAAEKL